MYVYKFILKYYFVFLVLCLLSCKNEQGTLGYPKNFQHYHLFINDSVEKFYEFESKIINQALSECSFNNPITQHFKNHINPKTLEKLHF